MGHFDKRFGDALPVTPEEHGRREQQRRREIAESEMTPSEKEFENQVRAGTHLHYDARANLITTINTRIENCPIEWCQVMRLARLRGEIA